MSVNELPVALQDQAFCQVSALDTGLFNLPEKDFVKPANPDASFTAPSMSFLVRHHNKVTRKEELLIFDLGLRRDISSYLPALQPHLRTRQPFLVETEAREVIAKGGLKPEDVDYVVVSSFPQPSLAVVKLPFLD